MTEDNKNQTDQIDTGGGSYIGEKVDTAGGDFIGRDKTVNGDEIRSHVTSFSPVTHKQVGVTISGKGHRITGDIVGGSKVNSTLYVINDDLFQRPMMEREGFISELQKLVAEIVSAADRDMIDREESIFASAQVAAAISNAKKTTPDLDKIEQRINDAKEIISKTAAGAEVLAGLVAALTRAIEMVHSLSNHIVDNKEDSHEEHQR